LTLTRQSVDDRSRFQLSRVAIGNFGFFGSGAEVQLTPSKFLEQCLGRIGRRQLLP